MFRKMRRSFPLATFVISLISLTTIAVRGQCPPPLVTNLRMPLSITQSNIGNLIVSEAGTPALHSGRISIIDAEGNRRTLVDGLPSAISDVGEPSGPTGVFMRGRTLYLAIGIGNSLLPQGMGVTFGNPNPASPLFSSVLALHFSANVEKNTTGFALTFAQQTELADGHRVTLSNGPEKLTVEMIANFPNFTPNAPPPGNARGSNPFDLVVVGDQIYVTDGGQNAVRKIDIPTGTFSTLVTFPPVPNPLFPMVGPPNSEAVPTGIRYEDGRLLVTRFSGVPFAPGLSTVEQVNPITGATSTLIGGRKTAIDVIQLDANGGTDYLVLQHASPTGPFFPPPGLLLLFDTPASAPTTVSNCFIRPTSMVLDEKAGTIYVTELGASMQPFPGNLKAVPFNP